MSKLIAVINVMVANGQKITKAEPAQSQKGEIVFIYDNKHLWSISRETGDYRMWYYPGGPGMFDTIAGAHDEWDGIDMVYYGPETFSTREARASVAELYQVVSEKQYGMDAVFKDILDSDDIPF